MPVKQPQSLSNRKLPMRTKTSDPFAFAQDIGETQQLEGSDIVTRKKDDLFKSKKTEGVP